MQVVLSQDASRELSSLPKNQQIKAKRKISLLEKTPLAGKKLQGELKDRYSIRTWPYRIIYKINKVEKRVEIIAILHRQGAYR